MSAALVVLQMPQIAANFVWESFLTLAKKAEQVSECLQDTKHQLLQQGSASAKSMFSAVPLTASGQQSLYPLIRCVH